MPQVQTDWQAQFVLLGSIPLTAASSTYIHRGEEALKSLLASLAPVDKTLAEKLTYLLESEHTVFGVGNLSDALEAAGLPSCFIGLDSRAVGLTGSAGLVAGGAGRRMGSDEF